MNNQQKVWNNIAQEWYKFKTKPSKQTLKFLKNTTGKVLDLGSGAGRHLVKIKKEKMINWRDKGKRYYYLYEEKEVHDLFKKV